MGQRQSYRSRVSTVLGLVWGFLGLVMSAMITPAARAVAPSAKSAPMCWRSLYIGAWLVAFNAAGMRPIGRGAQGSALCRSRAPLGMGRDALAPASLCLHARPHTYRPANGVLLLQGSRWRLSLRTHCR